MKNSKMDQNSTPADTLLGTWPKHLGFFRIRTDHYFIDDLSLTQQKQISTAAIALTSKKRCSD